jgi:hypothetical protein
MLAAAGMAANGIAAATAIATKWRNGNFTVSA